MTDIQRGLARHALGLPNGQNTTNRNHYCVEAGQEGYSEWEDLVAQGLAVKYHIAPPLGSGDFFRLTREGARKVLLAGEYISAEDAEKML